MGESASIDIAAARVALETARTEIRARLGRLADWRALAQLIEREAKGEPLTAVDGAALKSSLETAIQGATPLFGIARRLDALIASLDEPTPAAQSPDVATRPAAAAQSPAETALKPVAAPARHTTVAAPMPVSAAPEGRPRFKVRAGTSTMPPLTAQPVQPPKIEIHSEPQIGSQSDASPSPQPAAAIMPPRPVTVVTAKPKPPAASIPAAAAAIAAAASAVLRAKPQQPVTPPQPGAERAPPPPAQAPNLQESRPAVAPKPVAPEAGAATPEPKLAIEASLKPSTLKPAPPTPAVSDPASNAPTNSDQGPLADWPRWLDPIPTQRAGLKAPALVSQASLNTIERLSALEAELDRLVQVAAPVPAPVADVAAPTKSVAVQAHTGTPGATLGLDGLTGEDLLKNFDGREAEIEIVPAQPRAQVGPSAGRPLQATSPTQPDHKTLSARDSGPSVMPAPLDDVEEASVEIIVKTPGAQVGTGAGPAPSSVIKPLELQRAPRQRFLKALTGE